MASIMAPGILSYLMDLGLGSCSIIDPHSQFCPEIHWDHRYMGDFAEVFIGIIDSLL